MKDRQKKILKSVVKEYQRTGQPVASQVLVRHSRFDFSPATVRAEMLALDQEGFLEQPHTSAGRVPTDKALRFYLEEINEEEIAISEKAQISRQIERLHEDSVREMAQFLADCTQNMGLSGLFGRLMDFHGAGLKWLAQEPELEDNSLKNILKSLDSLEEDFNRFFREIDERVEVFVGRENPIKYLRDCSLMVTGLEDEQGRRVFGILGPKRMNYSKNRFVLEETKKKFKKVKSKK